MPVKRQEFLGRVALHFKIVKCYFQCGNASLSFRNTHEGNIAGYRQYLYRHKKVNGLRTGEVVQLELWGQPPPIHSHGF